MCYYDILHNLLESAKSNTTKYPGTLEEGETYNDIFNKFLKYRETLPENTNLNQIKNANNKFLNGFWLLSPKFSYYYDGTRIDNTFIKFLF